MGKYILNHSNGTVYEITSYSAAEEVGGSFVKVAENTYLALGTSGSTNVTPAYIIRSGKTEKEYVLSAATSIDLRWSSVGTHRYTIPRTGSYYLEVAGSGGAGNIGAKGGNGALVTSTIKISKGSILTIFVGSYGTIGLSGGESVSTPGESSSLSGSTVTTIVAGGGGAAIGLVAGSNAGNGQGGAGGAKLKNGSAGWVRIVSKS